MEISFTREIDQLRRGSGETFHGEGILAITKALLQSGVAYVGGYQGAPVSHLLDVMVQAKPYMDELGVHVEACSNEASAAAMLGASLHYPLRGAVTWKSIVGTNVAADALSNLSSPGVKGGALIIVGEDYGEGASVIQERTQAFALKSSMALFDPRPELANMVRMVDEAFRLSEASNMPAILQLRIRACHVRGSFECRDNVAPAVSTRQPLAEPAAFDYGKLAHPPVIFGHEKLKIAERIPAARRMIAERGLNELFEGKHDDLGLIVQGGLYNSLVRALQQFGLADAFGAAEIPLLVLNVTFPLVPEQIGAFCSAKRAVLVLEEGSPEYIEQEIATALRRRDIDTPLHGKDLLPAAGEYSVEVIAQGLVGFVERYLPDVPVRDVAAWLDGNRERRDAVPAALERPLPARPPNFCIGCPERPVFAALKLAQNDVGKVHITADIGCHAFATFEPFTSGHSILGYGMSLASRAGVSPMMERRTLAIMGDGGFWHDGLITGVQSALFNEDDAVLLIFKNGYTSATGTQEIISTPSDAARAAAADRLESIVHTNRTIETTLKGLGVQWLRVVHTYRVAEMKRTLVEAFTTPFAGLKVIVAEGECQLERQRRIKPWLASLLQRGQRVVRVKYGVDEDVCNGDHACIRLSGCPTLTLKDNPDPLKVDPVATVIDGCVGCGLCGENAHAATLCPSFYRAEVIVNPKWHERLIAAVRGTIVGALQSRTPNDDDVPAAEAARTARGNALQSAPAHAARSPRPQAAGSPPAHASRDACHPGDQAMTVDRPVSILICALGGEGGGVLTEWLVDAAARAGYAAQSTSIPGVAQRTGATTYYVEIFPTPIIQLGGRHPVFSLYPVPGALDLLVSSELLETVRQIGNGMTAADRTMIVTSLARTLTTSERMQQADGRVDSDALLDVVHRFAREARALDMDAMTREAGTVVSAVMFGAIGASGLLPFGREACEAVIRGGGDGGGGTGGKSADASLAGFALAFEHVAADRRRVSYVEQLLASDRVASTTRSLRATLPPAIASRFPSGTHAMLQLGHARVVEYQDAAYGALYLERMARVIEAEQRSDRSGAHGCAITVEVARYLALWMAFDDIVRVAELKSRASREERLRREVKPGMNDVLRIYDHFKPGIPEIAALLPVRLAGRLLGWDRRRQRRGRPAWALPLKLPTHAVTGMLALRILGGLKGMRPRGGRFATEQALIERWLRAVLDGTAGAWSLGLEIALSGRLIKGYGSTNERGKENLLHIVDHLARAGEIAGAGEADTANTREGDDAHARAGDGMPARGCGDAEARAAAIGAARAAALADENGTALDRTLVAHGAPPRPAKAVPIRFVRKTAAAR